jgi:hypothetical protein
MSATTTTSGNTSIAASGSNDRYNAIAAFEAKGELKAFQYQPLPLAANDEIAIHCCGVCYTISCHVMSCLLLKLFFSFVM